VSQYVVTPTRDDGVVPDHARDLAWDAISTVAERLNARTEGTTLEVRAKRRRIGRRVVEGIEVVDRWTNVWEPVRERPAWARNRWREVQPVQTAASKIGTFLRERPDLAR
jgi:hypothetical protein